MNGCLVNFLARLFASEGIGVELPAFDVGSSPKNFPQFFWVSHCVQGRAGWLDVAYGELLRVLGLPLDQRATVAVFLADDRLGIKQAVRRVGIRSLLHSVALVHGFRRLPVDDRCGPVIGDVPEVSVPA